MGSEKPQCLTLLTVVWRFARQKGRYEKYFDKYFQISHEKMGERGNHRENLRIFMGGVGKSPRQQFTGERQTAPAHSTFWYISPICTYLFQSLIAHNCFEGTGGVVGWVLILIFPGMSISNNINTDINIFKISYNFFYRYFQKVVIDIVIAINIFKMFSNIFDQCQYFQQQEMGGS